MYTFVISCVIAWFHGDIHASVSVFSRKFLQDKQELVAAFIAATLTITIVLGRHYLRVTCTSPRKMITVRVTLHLLCPLLFSCGRKTRISQDVNYGDISVNVPVAQSIAFLVLDMDVVIFIIADFPTRLSLFSLRNIYFFCILYLGNEGNFEFI